MLPPPWPPLPSPVNGEELGPFFRLPFYRVRAALQASAIANAASVRSLRLLRLLGKISEKPESLDSKGFEGLLEGRKLARILGLTRPNFGFARFLCIHKKQAFLFWGAFCSD